MSDYTQHATITVTAKDWDEAPVGGADAVPYLARMVYKTVYSGEMDGESTCALLTSYVGGDPAEPHSLTGPYTGYEQVTGTLGGRSGSLVLAVQGFHGDGVARTEVSIVAGSGTGELAGIRGVGRYAAEAMEYTMNLDYDFGQGDR